MELTNLKNYYDYGTNLKYPHKTEPRIIKTVSLEQKKEHRIGNVE
jgi:hypothetical protein